jgi:hypothetical protein
LVINVAVRASGALCGVRVQRNRPHVGSWLLRQTAPRCLRVGAAVVSPTVDDVVVAAVAIVVAVVAVAVFAAPRLAGSTSRMPGKTSPMAASVKNHETTAVGRAGDAFSVT